MTRRLGRTARLSELASVLGGGTPSKQDPTYWEGSIPWISPKDMKRWEIFDATDHVSDKAVQESACKLIPPPAVLLVVRGMILAHSIPVAITRVPLTVNQDTKALCPRDGVDADYLAIMLAGAVNQLLPKVEVAGHGTRRLPTEAWESLELVVPEMSEQRRIVARVQTMRAHINEARSLRAENEVLQRALVSLFLRELEQKAGRRHVTVGSVVTGTRNGRSFPTDEVGGNCHVLTLGAVREVVLDPSKTKRAAVDVKTVHTYQVGSGDVFVSRSNTRELVGMSSRVIASVPEPCIYPDLLIRLEPDTTRVDPSYLALFSEISRITRADPGEGEGDESEHGHDLRSGAA